MHHTVCFMLHQKWKSVSVKNMLTEACSSIEGFATCLWDKNSRFLLCVMIVEIDPITWEQNILVRLSGRLNVGRCGKTHYTKLTGTHKLSVDWTSATVPLQRAPLYNVGTLKRREKFSLTFTQPAYWHILLITFTIPIFRCFLQNFPPLNPSKLNDGCRLHLQACQKCRQFAIIRSRKPPIGHMWSRASCHNRQRYDMLLTDSLETTNPQIRIVCAL